LSGTTVAGGHTVAGAGGHNISLSGTTVAGGHNDHLFILRVLRAELSNSKH